MNIMYQSIQKPPIPPPPGQTPWHLTFLKNFGSIPRYVASLDGQMPHSLELQRGSNPPPSRHVKATVQNFFPCVKPFIQMYIFCNKQLATVWIKICVNCNFNAYGNRVICYIKTQLKYPVSQSYLTEVLNFNKNVPFRKPTFNGLFKRL